jgi:hypothetical protein
MRTVNFKKIHPVCDCTGGPGSFVRNASLGRIARFLLVPAYNIIDRSGQPTRGRWTWHGRNVGHLQRGATSILRFLIVILVGFHSLVVDEALVLLG